MESNGKKHNDTANFYSPSFGKMDLHTVRTCIIAFMEEYPDAQYRLVIGSDSQYHNNRQVDFVTAIIVHRIGGGGIYFWKRIVSDKKYVLRQRIYEEALHSLSTATEFVGMFRYNGISHYEIEIHVDIGTMGETREMIGEVVGMIRGSGFNVKTKPEAFGASSVADRHT
jgi:predicted RNase H-related nuclease YkuK (DUF458 family)